MKLAVLFFCCAAFALPAAAQNLLVNGNFETGDSTGWTPWVVRNHNADLAIGVDNGELTISGSNIDAGVYQQFNTGGPGHVVNVGGRWLSEPALPDAMWGEVWVINADRVPVDGVSEVDGVNNAILLYRNDTLAGRGAWNDVMPRSAPVKNQVSFLAAADKATLILKSANTGPATPTGVRFDDMRVHGLAPPATLDALPPGFASRSYTFPITNVVSIAQSPVSRHIYTISNESTAANTQLRRIITTGPSLSSVVVPGLGSLVDFAQGLTFDAAGNIYISTQYGKLIKGTDTNPDPAIDAFTFVLLLDMPDLQIGTFHGVGGIAVGPDNKLYINSGSESHYGYLSNGSPEIFAGRLNARILRCDLDGTNLETFCEGIRNSYDIAFRLDGRLFGVENGPNTGCDYAEEFNLLEAGRHYGFPYKYGDDISGSDSSIACQNSGGGNVLGPPPLPDGLTVTPSWANYGPDGKPPVGGVGYQDGGVYYGFHPHSSPDGLSFYEPTRMDLTAIKFPPEYHGRAFVARLGQLENVPKVGFDVMTLRLDDANAGFFCNTFLTGMARCIDVLCAYDGRVYVVEYNQQTDWPAGGWGTASRLHEIRYTIPSGPSISVSPSVFDRTVYHMRNLANDTFAVANAGIGTLNYTITRDRTWIDVSPTVGDSTGPTDVDTITISYTVAGLPIGTHAATVTISDPLASNNPQTVTINVQVRPIPPDADGDADVDLSDFSFFQACFNGPNRSPAFAGCESTDYDGDGDTDLSDFGVLQSCFNGPNRPPATGCAI